jgi:O-antigen/teichoic acid export membrane protein
MIVLLQILCLSMMWFPVHAINLNVLQVIGRSDLFLKLEIIKRIVGIVILCITLPMGIVELCIGQVVSTWISLYINTFYSGKLLQAGFFTQMKFLFPQFVNSLLMAAIVMATNSLLPENEYTLQIVVGICVGALYYFVVAYLFNRNTLKELLSVFKR